VKRCERRDLVHLLQYLLLLLVSVLDQDRSIRRSAVHDSVCNEANLVDTLFSQHLLARDIAEYLPEDLLVALCVNLAVALLGELRGRGREGGRGGVGELVRGRVVGYVCGPLEDGLPLGVVDLELD
jgi:hypothetical protein